MGSPMPLSSLTLSDLERSKSRSLRFRSLISCKGAYLGSMLLLNINRKPYMDSPMALSNFECPCKVKVKVTEISKPYISYRSIVNYFEGTNYYFEETKYYFEGTK